MRKVSALVVGVGLIMMAGSLAAQAQSTGKDVVAKVQFGFNVGDKALPAGTYRVTQPGSGMGNLKIQSADGKNEASAAIITRLASEEHAGHSREATLVFDKVGDQRFLSEVWMPGQDGYLVRGTSEEHQHVVVKTAK